jgi:RNA polymerase sigma factor (sigma-70 family)
MAWYSWGLTGVGTAVVVIAVNELYRRIKKRRSGLYRGINSRNNPSAYRPGGDFYIVSTSDFLDAAIAGLPENERVVMTMYYYDEMSMSDVAAQLGIPVKTANKRRERAVSRIRPGLRAHLES